MQSSAFATRLAAADSATDTLAKGGGLGKGFASHCGLFDAIEGWCESKTWTPRDADRATLAHGDFGLDDVLLPIPAAG